MKSLASLNRQLLSLVLLVGGIAFIMVLLGRGWAQIETLLDSADWGLLALSSVMGLASMLFTSLFFAYLLRKHRLCLDSADVHRLFFYGQIAKYVPGKIWGVLYQATSVNQEGGIRKVGAANLDLMLISMMTNSVIGVALLASGMSFMLSAAVFLLGLLLTVYASRSQYTSRLVGWLAGKLGQKLTAEESAEVSVSFSGWPVVQYYLMMAFTGVLAYYLMLHAVFSYSFSEVIAYIGYLVLAWVAGVFMFLAPAGMGVRELVFIAFGAYMGPKVSVDTLAAIAVVSRIWQIAQELFAALAVLVWGVLSRWRQ